MSDDQTLEICGACGATIYPEHITSRKAERISGTLLCVHCVREKRGETDAAAEQNEAEFASANGVHGAAGTNGVTAVASPPRPRAAIQFERAAPERKTEYRRPTLADPAVATRCRVFHCRLNDASIRNMEDQVNAWVDAQEEVRIKFSTTTVGTFEGKAADPHLILTVFY
ncbi:MAG: hypothetical protein SF069_09620 [Phycisphaerae bacterium]|nr:hypothetical protein [Phycisphaerae bacterium]